jgi:AcrR family transcriptional regulator
MQGAMNKKVERGKATRLQILEAARALFIALGYEATSIEDILQELAISRGALYHHFKNKEAVFEAVLESVEAEIAKVIINAAKSAPDPLAGLHAGCDAWLELALDPAVRTIVLSDAPTAVGWAKWREIDSRYGFGLLRASLKRLSAMGMLPPELVDLFSHMLLAVLLEICLVIARADDPKTELKEGRVAVRELLDRLLKPEGHAQSSLK